MVPLKWFDFNEIVSKNCSFVILYGEFLEEEENASTHKSLIPITHPFEMK